MKSDLANHLQFQIIPFYRLLFCCPPKTFTTKICCRGFHKTSNCWWLITPLPTSLSNLSPWSLTPWWWLRPYLEQTLLSDSPLSRSLDKWICVLDWPQFKPPVLGGKSADLQCRQSFCLYEVTAKDLKDYVLKNLYGSGRGRSWGRGDFFRLLFFQSQVRWRLSPVVHVQIMHLMDVYETFEDKWR